ncbi:proline dehydrogenase family protein [Riemerella columbipharyngis]|uniref:Proline dehydrogenase n=1 Tax=Riemerella columbipharyngis TaxID=1071918 RepID=A0A1G7BIF4_9FLAO|nr:proline dehydrogenase family protein [Riemerella columbipharyngis]SDE26891.1 proline dehydrogenase [Riemerella columbipharyngis]
MGIFDNTKIAFADKSTKQLKKAQWMFTMIQHPTLTNVGIKALNFSIRNNFPFVQSIVKSTLFEQFCGGVTREDSKKVVEGMYKHHIGSIFDYAIEGQEDEKTFDHTCEETKKDIEFAKGNPAIPFVVFKPTGFGRLDLYADVQAGKTLSAEEQAEWTRIVRRYEEVCQLAYDRDVLLMIDAEESWIQTAVDDLVNEMKARFNKEKAIVWNTIQMYRTGRLEYLAEDLQRAKSKGYYLGYKFVRGAYMEKERERAVKMGYPSPIQPNKEASDKNYNAAINFVMENLDTVSAFFGTHNEFSTKLIMDKMKEKSIAHDSKQIYFGQLYGMSDNITYFLGSEKYNACKYLPYGPVKEVVPYLTRRAQENTSVAGQTGRELSLIKKELQRRQSEK